MKTNYIIKKIQKSVSIISLLSVAGLNTPVSGITLSNAASSATANPIVRLKINTTNFNDETVFYFLPGGTTAFQPAFDAYKLLFNAGTHPYIGSMSDSILTDISGLPELPTNLSIPVKAISPATGSFTFSTETSDFPGGVCVTLYDAFTGISTSILTSDYVCTLYDTTSIVRFKMNFFTTSLNASSFVKQADCLSPNGAFITAKGTNSGPWNYEWKSGDSIIKTSLNKSTPDSLTFLNPGNYTVRINSVGQCDNFSRIFSIDSVVHTKAAFSADVFTTTISNSGKIDFKNNSTNAQFSSWDFGDNSGTWYVPSPSYNYPTAGIYTVTLITESISHCKSTVQQVIEVKDDVTGIRNFDNRENISLATLSQGSYKLNFSLSSATDLKIQLFDLNGKLLQNTELKQVLQTSHTIELENATKGMFLLKVSSGNSFEKTYKLLN